LVTASLAALAVTIAYALVGFLGVAIIGVATLFVCVHLELSHEHPAGGMIYPPDHPWRAGENDGTGRAAGAVRHSERAALRQALILAKLLGVALTLVGFGGFYLFQLG
ncbi:MAG: hypothetical protein ACJ8DG_09150, partial [Microvirga sp.]